MAGLTEEVERLSKLCKELKWDHAAAVEDEKETNAALLSAEDEVERLVRHAALFSASHCMAMPFQCAACGHWIAMLACKLL